jgi:hypothetical protein
MRNFFILLVFVLGTQFALSAQTPDERRLKANVDRYIERVENNTTLTEEERAKVFEIKSVHTKSIWAMDKELEGKPDLITERKKEINRTFTKSLIDAFGKDRGIEIAKASQGKN